MTSPADHRVRLRFQEFHLEKFPDGRCRARVRMEWTRGRTYLGEGEGTQTLEGELRAAAQATLEAASDAAGGRVRLELRGVKAVRAFDSWVVVVSVLIRPLDGSEGLRLMGVHPCPDEDTPRGAVMAILDAINRVLERYLED